MMFKGFQKPKRLVANTETLTDRYGLFTAQPFERGFGYTIGVGLSRILLSAIDGAAITAVKIEGVKEDRMDKSIKGVQEDPTDLILNLKQIPLRMASDGIHTIRLNVSKPGEVLSGQLETGGDVEVLDRTMHIATIQPGGSLELECRIKPGRGYVPAERNKDEDLPHGYIPIDSVHSPVRKVKHAVEGARLGQNTEYDKLTLEVWTNGAVSPQDAIAVAARLYKDHMSLFINFEEEPEAPVETVAEPSNAVADLLSRSVDEMELSVRSYNCLKNANISTISDLVQKTEAEMLRTKNFGRKSLSEIKEILTRMGLSLGMKVDSQGRLLTPGGQQAVLPPQA